MALEREIEVPYELGFEEYFLGSVFLGAGKKPVLRASSRLVAPEMFGNPINQRIYAAMLEMLEKGIEEPDPVLVLRHMGKRTGDRQRIEDVMLRASESVSTPANWRHYAAHIREAWQKRELVIRCEELRQMASDPDKPAKELMRAFDRIGRKLGLGGNPSIDASEVDLSSKKGHAGLPSGFTFIDRSVVSRGYIEGQTSLIVAGQKVGKTSVMISFVNANPGKRIGFVTLEMTPEQILLGCVKQIHGTYRPSGDMFEDAGHKDALEAIRKRPVVFFDGTQSEGETTIEEVCAWAIDEHDLEPIDALVLDYVQLLSTSERTGFDSVREMSIVSRKLVKLSKRLGIPVLAGSQATEKDGVLVTKQARKFEEDAGLVVNLTRKLDDNVGKMRIKLNRFGPSGIESPVTWDAQYLRYSEVG